MIKYRLKINDSNTEFLLSTFSFLKQQFNDLQIKAGNSQIYSSITEFNQGAINENSLNLKYHINSVYRFAYFHVKNICSDMNILADDVCSQLTYALVTVRIGYCDSLLYGLSDQSLI